MNNYFECKISYEKTMENGKEKKVSEPYLVDALSFTEAESRIIEEVKPFASIIFFTKINDCRRIFVKNDDVFQVRPPKTGNETD